LVEAQKRVAKKTGSAFWNLFEAMGGKNSMVNWVEGDTVLANKDYTHLNHRGASKVAKLLYKHLMDEYNVYNASSAKKNLQASSPLTNKESSPSL
jgi:lysophospholipase L1-like esterase